MILGRGRPSLKVEGSTDAGREEPLDLVEADVRGRSMLSRRIAKKRQETERKAIEGAIIK
jgi:hypothetical protein